MDFEETEQGAEIEERAGSANIAEDEGSSVCVNERKGKRILIKDATGRCISFCGSALSFKIVIGGSIELLQGETYTISVEDFDE